MPASPIIEEVDALLKEMPFNLTKKQVVFYDPNATSEFSEFRESFVKLIDKSLAENYYISGTNAISLYAMCYSKPLINSIEYSSLISNHSSV